MRALEFITGHVIFKLRYNQIYQLKTTLKINLLVGKNRNKYTEILRAHPTFIDNSSSTTYYILINILKCFCTV